MKGLEISRSFYDEFGAPMLSAFTDVLPYVAVGLCGSGSECGGFDDEISRDHDFEPGFCIFIPDESTVDRKTAFALERAYAKLPKEYCGLTRLAVSPVGGSRHGVIRTADFFTEKVGSPDGVLTVERWLRTPQYALFEATNGAIFSDNYGEVSRIRRALLSMPEDVTKKRLAGNLLIMAQSGQYNYMRCISHGETAAAQLAVFEFCKAAVEVIFLLNGRYMPYYKWCFRALRELPLLSSGAESFEFLITTENTPDLSETKYFMIEEIASSVISVLQQRDLTKAICGDLEKHAYSVNDSIDDPNIRNLNIFYCV